MKRWRAQPLRFLAAVALAASIPPVACSCGRASQSAPASRVRIEPHREHAATPLAGRDAPVVALAVEAVVAEAARSIVQLVASMPPKSAHAPLRVLEGDPFVVMRAGPLGSGVVVGHNLVLTTAHVVEHAGDIVARLSDGRALSATVIARDGTHDLALLRLRGDLARLRPIPLGQNAPRPGEVVVAIGNLYGLGPTVTIGVVSSANEAGTTASDTLATDAAINLSNTGGPILNLRGELVGIANAKLTERRAMRGLSYAIAGHVLGPLMEGLTVGDAPLRKERALDELSALRGVGHSDIDPALRLRYGISENVSHGAVVTGVAAGSPAATVGIEPGDVVVEVDFVPVLSSRILAQATTSEGPLLVLVVRGNAAAYILVHP